MKSSSPINPKLLNRVKNIINLIAGSTTSGTAPKVIFNKMRTSGGLLNKLYLLKSISLALLVLVLMLTVLVLVLYWKLPETQNKTISPEELRVMIEAKVAEEAKRRGLQGNLQVTWVVQDIPAEGQQDKLSKLSGSVVLKKEDSAPDVGLKMIAEEKDGDSIGELSTQDETVVVSKAGFSVESNRGFGKESELVTFGMEGLKLKLTRTSQ